MKGKEKQRQETEEMGCGEGDANGGADAKKGTDFEVAVEEEVRREWQPGWG